MQRVRAMMGALGLVLLAGCAKPATAPATGSAADEQAIRAMADQYIAAFNKRDVGAMTALLATDYQTVEPTGRHLTSSAQFDTTMKAEIGQVPAAMQLSGATTYVRWINGNAAVAGGTYKAAGLPPGMPNQGSWVVVVVKQDSAWKIITSLGADDMTPLMASDSGAVKK